MCKLYLFQNPGAVPVECIQRMLLFLPEERSNKAIRYRQKVDRNNCVISYVMLRIALKECYGIGMAEKLEFRYNEFGKPMLAKYPEVHFSISHCRDACVVVVADSPIGVDVQEIRSFSWDVAERVCCENELRVLKESSEREREFTRMWAMKESYAKMLGLGVACEFRGIDTTQLNYVHVSEHDEDYIALSVRNV